MAAIPIQNILLTFDFSPVGSREGWVGLVQTQSKSAAMRREYGVKTRALQDGKWGTKFSNKCENFFGY